MDHRWDVPALDVCGAVHPGGDALIYPELFKRRYPQRRGRDWLRYVEADDRRAFSLIGIAHRKAGYGKKGGDARKQKAIRDSKGRFTSAQTSPANAALR